MIALYSESTNSSDLIVSAPAVTHLPNPSIHKRYLQQSLAQCPLSILI